jgi:hypothetical protein
MVVDDTRHCYKCNSYQPALGGALLLDVRRRRRFVCATCCERRSAPRVEGGQAAKARQRYTGHTGKGPVQKSGKRVLECC